MRRSVPRNRSRRRPPRSTRGSRVHLVFSYVHPSKPSHTLGPFPRIWLNVEGMRSEPDGALRAAYLKHQWEVEGLSYFRLDCTSTVRVHFTRPGETSRQ